MLGWHRLWHQIRPKVSGRAWDRRRCPQRDESAQQPSGTKGESLVKWTRQSAFKWHRWRRERRLLIATVHLLSSLKPVLVLWESPSFCFQLSSCFAFCRKKIFPSKRANLSQHHVLHQLIVFVRFILLWINFLLRDTKPRRFSVKLFCGLLFSILQISWTAPLEISLSCPFDFRIYISSSAQLVGFVFIIGIVQPFPRSTTPLMKTF